jgi:uncharacterized protein YdhG (YjbR/CyaY superfamily)
VRCEKVDKDRPVSATVDEYIAGQPPEVQERLRTLRQVIREAAPDATEKISYGMPTFVLHGNLIHYAAHTRHIGIYPMPTAVEAFKDELASYQNAKGSVQFPLDRPMPYDLIARIVRFRVDENTRKAEDKAKKRK